MMDNHQQNGLNPTSNTNAVNNTENSSNGSSLSSSTQTSLYTGISGRLLSPQMFQNNHPVFNEQNLTQENPNSNALSPPPAMLNPFLEYSSNRGGTITPSIASSYTSKPPTNMLQRPDFSTVNNSVNTSKGLKAVASIQCTAASGVIVPGVGISRSSSGGKRGGNASKNNGGKCQKRQRRISSVAAAATTALAAAPGPTPTTTLGGVTIPSIHPQASTALQVQIAAAAAAAEAAPLKPKGGNSNAGAKSKSSNNLEFKNKDKNSDKTAELSTEEKAKLNRDRNREHARSTRLRKKAYVNKLKELVDGLHAERTEETKKNRVAVQHLSEVQAVRKNVMRTFLKFLSSYESDHRKWDTLMEDSFWLKQPITPYRSFPRSEIENECRKTRGIDGMITESASMSVMIEGIGSRSVRWMHIKREEFLLKQDNTPSTVMGQNTNVQNAVSSLSSSSGSSNGNGSGNEEDLNQHRKMESSLRTGVKTNNKSLKQKLGTNATSVPNKVSSGSSSEYRQDTNNNTSNEYHVYNAPSLPDPMYSGESCAGSESTNEINGVNMNSVCTDSSSTDEDNKQPEITMSKSRNKEKNIKEEKKTQPVDKRECKESPSDANCKANGKQPQRKGLPPNIAKGGGIVHNIRPVSAGVDSKSNLLKNGKDRLSVSPVTPLPPFLGIGKRQAAGKKTSQESINTTAQVTNSATSSKPPLPTKSKPMVPKSGNISGIMTGKLHSSAGSSRDSPSESAGPLFSSPGVGTDTSSSSSTSTPQIKAYFHVNEDDMLLTDDILMCPFIFRSQDAVLCGALAECIMPGMLRAHFSSRNKLLNLEMIYDAMGFMQQLERASGREGTAQIIPNSLDMALVPIADEPRIITLAKPPFSIVSVNEAWTKMTKYTQMDVEGKELKILHGKGTDVNAGVRPKKPCHTYEEVGRGRCACSVNRYYDKTGSEFIEFSCSYPLSK